MTVNRNRRCRGNSALEFTLVGIPLICVLITTAEVSRGMWYYHTLAHAIKAGARYAVVHGQGCTKAPNACAVTISRIARVIRTSGVGLASESLMLTFTDANGSAASCRLSECIANYDVVNWPPPSANAPGQVLTISGTYPFRSAMLMFWPGAGGGLGPPGTINFSTASREGIQF